MAKPLSWYTCYDKGVPNTFWGLFLTVDELYTIISTVDELYTITSIIAPHPTPDLDT